MNKNYSFHIGTSTNLTYNPEADYNKAGSILFTKDTNELFINIDDVSSGTEQYRKQVNSLYSTAVKGVDSNNKPLIFNATTLNEMYGKIKNHTEELDKKMSMVNPKGSGNFNFGQNNTINNDSTNSIVVGQSLKQGQNNSNSITGGRYNVLVDNALLTIGSGTSESSRKNAFTIISSDNLNCGIFSNDLYINTGGNTTSQPDNEFKVLTSAEIDEKISDLKKDLEKQINNLSFKPIYKSKKPPETNTAISPEDLEKIHLGFWLDISENKGHGVLNYWEPNTVGDGGSWVEVSAIFT